MKYNNISTEFKLEIVIGLDDIESKEIAPRFTKLKGLVDASGNPIEAYHKERYGIYETYYSLNGVIINAKEFFSKWQEKSRFICGQFSIERNESTDKENNYSAVKYFVILPRLDYVQLRCKELEEFFKEIFDVDIEIK